MYRVKVSARLLHFPKQCCCCGDNRSGSEYRAVASRTKGTKVVRTESKWWDFPLCPECSEWMDTQHSANSSRNWFLGFVVLALLTLPLGITLILSPQTVAFGVLLILAGLVVGIFAPFQFKTWRRGQTLANELKPHRSCYLEPVVYSGWNGTVHTFYFTQQLFCQSFMMLNEKKLVD